MTVALLDACVLYPPGLRDLFMWLAVEKVYRPRWTDAIHEEWIRNVLKNHPELTSGHLARARELMDAIDPECLVTGYEAYIPALTLPDENDCHVLAAAIEAKASVIVTYNLSDFPEETLALYGIQPLHPDTYLSSLLDAKPVPFLTAARKHRASLKRPPKTGEEYLESLKGHSLSNLAILLDAYRDEI